MPASNHSYTHATAISINGDASQLALILDAQLVGASCLAPCPAHDDHDPSLHITQRDDRILLRCFAGCSQEEVLDALWRHHHIHRSDLFRGTDHSPHSTNGNGHVHSFNHVEYYPYTDEIDQLLFQTERLRCACGAKRFRQRRPDSNQPSEWIYNLKDTRRVLYRLPPITARA